MWGKELSYMPEIHVSMATHSAPVGTPGWEATYHQMVVRRYIIIMFNSTMSKWIKVSFSIIRLSLTMGW